MSRGKQRGSRKRATPSLPARERRISVLSCPTCGHESPADGDWDEVPADHGVEVGDTTMGNESVELRCPDCSTHLTSLPA